MPWISKERLEALEEKAFAYDQARMRLYWFHPGFVGDCFKHYLERPWEVSTICNQFDRDLEAYVEKRCEEKLAQARALVDEIKKVPLRDPFHGVRVWIDRFEGK